jgi:hypothetical protein
MKKEISHQNTKMLLCEVASLRSMRHQDIPGIFIKKKILFVFFGVLVPWWQ